MCLFPGGGFNMQPIVPPTAEGVKHKQRLYIVMIAHVLLSIMMMFLSIVTGIYELLGVLILWCAATQMHFCQLIIYIILCCNNFIAIFAFLGLLI